MKFERVACHCFINSTTGIIKFQVVCSEAYHVILLTDFTSNMFRLALYVNQARKRLFNFVDWNTVCFHFKITYHYRRQQFLYHNFHINIRLGCLILDLKFTLNAGNINKCQLHFLVINNHQG